ncbi:MAG TPA: hypothetical protein VJU81_00625 [Methylomirabilota bacterium]|nr:hypothetical protein [Methylomirabilota bacterium]
MRRAGRRIAAATLGLLAALGVAAVAPASDPVAVLTEIRPGKGEIRVKIGHDSAWKAPAPLLSLRPGDQVRATEDGRAVILFGGGRPPQTVQASNSPFKVPAPTGSGPTGQVGALASSVTSFLFGKQDKPAYVSAYVPLSTRSVRLPPPTLISPRATKLLTTPVVFEWSGSESQRYGVRVFGPDNAVLWEQTGLSRKDLPYPTSAPAFKPNVTYAWELHAERHPVQRAEFVLLAPAEVTRVKNDLASLPANGVSPTTVAVMRGSYLLKEGCYVDARRELLAAIAADPHEASLHQLLGHVYDAMGIKDLATDSFDEARFLSAPRP